MVFSDNHAKFCNEIWRILTDILHYFNISRKMTSTAKESHWEYFWKEVLNLVYWWTLIRLDKIQSNFPAVDLWDDENKICVQVTVENTRKKISKTIEKFEEKRLYEQYKILKFFLIFSWPHTHKKPFQTNWLYSFEKNSDIIAFDKLAKDIEEKEVWEVEKIRDRLTELYYNQKEEWWKEKKDLMDLQKYTIELQQNKLVEKDKIIEKLKKEVNKKNKDLTMEGDLIIYDGKDWLSF